jgi:DNA-binding CsgD family transcriptional regulator
MEHRRFIKKLDVPSGITVPTTLTYDANGGYLGCCDLYPMGRRTELTEDLLHHDVDMSWVVTSPPGSQGRGCSRFPAGATFPMRATPRRWSGRSWSSWERGSRPAHRLPGGLTARQLQVAALVADGLTNRQIAERLGIQERSAEGHVERIRLRLGVSSRTRIAAWWAGGPGAAEVAE